MKKLISFTMFLTLVLVVVLAKSSLAQVSTRKVKSGVVAPIGLSGTQIFVIRTIR